MLREGLLYLSCNILYCQYKVPNTSMYCKSWDIVPNECNSLNTDTWSLKQKKKSFFPFPGVETEESVGGVYQMLSAHQADVFPGSLTAASATAKERIWGWPRASTTVTGARSILHPTPGNGVIGNTIPLWSKQHPHKCGPLPSASFKRL